MFELQADQFGLINYAFTDDDGVTPADVTSIDVTSSNPEFLEVVAEPKTEVGIYPYRLNHKGIGVGTLDMFAEAWVDKPPFTDQEAFSTIPNIAEGFSKSIVINEL
jgi:hypothetical protein